MSAIPQPQPENIPNTQPAMPMPMPSATAGIFPTLAALAPATLVSESALADALGVTPRTIRRLVQRADLPPAVRLAGRAVWFAGRVIEFLQAKADAAAKAQEKDFARFRS